MALQIDIAQPTSATKASKPKRPKKTLDLASIGKRKRLAAKDRMFFTEQLSLLLATGTSLHPALVSIASQSAGTPLEDITRQMSEGVMNGHSLSEEMAKHPEAFSPMYVNLISASEGGGFLAEVLQQLCEIEEQNDRLKASLISAFSYPAFLIVFSVFTLVFILLVVFPKFADLFVSIGDQLPGTTKFLMATSGLLINHWMIVCAVIGAGIVACASWLKTNSGRNVIDSFKISAPLFSQIWHRVYVVVIFRVLGLSLKHGVSLVDAVKTSQTLVQNQRVTQLLESLSDTIEQGGRLAQGMHGAAWMPDLAKQMLATGEESGSLASVMIRMSEHYNRELERMLQRFSKMVEPIMLVVMGAMVGLLVSSLILPIFKLSHAVT